MRSIPRTESTASTQGQQQPNEGVSELSDVRNLKIRSLFGHCEDCDAAGERQRFCCPRLLGSGSNPLVRAVGSSHSVQPTTTKEPQSSRFPVLPAHKCDLHSRLS